MPRFFRKRHSKGARVYHIWLAPYRPPQYLGFVEAYIPILFFLLLLLGLGTVILMLARFLGPHRPGDRKEETYECGVPPFSNARVHFSIGFYLMALLFILFDVEILFLIPWALVVQEMGKIALFEMALFASMLFLGLIYIIRQGLFDEV